MRIARILALQATILAVIVILLSIWDLEQGLACDGTCYTWVPGDVERGDWAPYLGCRHQVLTFGKYGCYGQIRSATRHFNIGVFTNSRNTGYYYPFLHTWSEVDCTGCNCTEDYIIPGEWWYVELCVTCPGTDV